MSFQKPKGTEDYYPDEKETQQSIFNSFRTVAKKYNFREIETPAFEEMKLLTTKQGEEIKSQIFTLEKRSTEEFGLRFDLTVPATRLFVQKQRELQKPVKWFYVDKMWRYEQPQKGRLREFYQFGVELFGSDAPEADAEIINLAIDALQSVGLTNNDVVVLINNRVLLEGLLDFLPKEKFAAVLARIDKFEKIPREAFIAELEDLNVDAKRVLQILSLKTLGDVEKISLSPQAKQGLENLKQVCALLPKENVALSLTTVRGLAYYTGTVFEIFDRERISRSICGGGRYNNLVSQYGGEQTPATGFGMGYATLMLLLQQKKLLQQRKKEVDYYIAVIAPETKKEAFLLAKQLRKKNTVEIDLLGRSLSKQLQYANALGAKKLIVLGSDELTKGKYKIKDLKTGKEQGKPL